MSDSPLDKAADKLQDTVDDLSAQGGVKGKVADELADDPDFLRKLKPSLMVARARGEAPTDEQPGGGRAAPSGPQLGNRRSPEATHGQGGPSPFVVIGLAFALGYLLAKMIDWRGHAHPRD